MPEVADAVGPQRLKWMHGLYGTHEGETCGTCKHFWRQTYHRKVYFKCRMTRISRGPGTDWRVGWAACGRWERRDEDGE